MTDNHKEQGMREQNISNWGEFMGRVTEATGARTQVELAELLGIRQSSISDAKRRGQVPAAWLLQLLATHFLHPAWVLTGRGPRFMCPSEDGRTVADLAACLPRVEPDQADVAARLEALRRDVAALMPGHAVGFVVLPVQLTDEDGRCAVCGWQAGHHAPGCLVGADLTRPLIFSQERDAEVS